MRCAVTLLAAVGLLACRGDKKAEPSAESKAGDGPATVAPPASKPIPWMNLKVTVAGDARIENISANAPSAMIHGSGCTVMVGTVTDGFPSFENAVKQADRGIGNKAETWIKKQRTADGFHLEFEGTSLMHAKIHSVTVRRRIGDKAYECSRAGSREEVACVAAVCASLKPM